MKKEERDMRLSVFAVSALLCAAFSTGAYAAGGEIAVIVKTVNSNYWQNV
jgi:ribose transport system substrate-binding protein